MKLKFEYCECGCKCFSAGSKGIGYSISDFMDKKLYTLVRGHGVHGVVIGKFPSISEAEEAAQKDFDSIP